MLDLQISNFSCDSDNDENLNVTDLLESISQSKDFLNCYDSEIIMLFLHLSQIYATRTEEDFLLNLAQEVKCKTGLYEALIDINKIMMKYTK